MTWIFYLYEYLESLEAYKWYINAIKIEKNVIFWQYKYWFLRIKHNENIV